MLLRPQVEEVLGIGHSMGGHPLAESIRECALTCPYKLVFVAADQRQQEFHSCLSQVWQRRQNEAQFGCLASQHDKALKVSAVAHALPGMRAGQRAGQCRTSLCYDQDAFTTVECSAAHCAIQDTTKHSYIFTSAAVWQYIEAFCSGLELVHQLVERHLERNNNGQRETFQIHSLVD